MSVTIRLSLNSGAYDDVCRFIEKRGCTITALFLDKINPDGPAEMNNICKRVDISGPGVDCIVGLLKECFPDRLIGI